MLLAINTEIVVSIVLVYILIATLIGILVFERYKEKEDDI